MKRGEFTFDINAATLGLTTQYGNAYAISNEPLVQETGLVPVAGRKVLTVAASGDQPLMYASRGAAHVDTFDIKYNAHVITDFKSAAIKTVPMDEYIWQIKYIHHLPSVKHTGAFDKILARMPNETRTALAHFASGLRNDAFFMSDSGGDENLYAFCTRYSQMRKNIRGPFDFIWSDLNNLYRFLGNRKYDIINLSNIFDYYPNWADILRTLKSLWPHLNTGGHVVCSAFCSPYHTIPETGGGWINRHAAVEYISTPKHLCSNIILVQKVR